MNTSSTKQFVRALLICISCDLPATRKICGFQNFNAKHGCSKCLKEFPTISFGSKPNYGGYERQNWLLRDNSMHKSKALESKSAKTATSRVNIEQSYGAKYSELLQLPAFDVVRFHIIDPMHAIFLGLAKHTTKTWKDLNILSASSYSILQDKVDSITPPTKIGRIPRKIRAAFVSFTADKNWILYYSVFSLHGIIPQNHFECWCLLVDACQLLCQPILNTDQVHKAHHLLVQFCKTFENLYGSSHCTPNMHMSCHLKDCILDFGPLSSFWCFPFERYNGFLEGFQKSWNGPEKQMVRKFLSMQYINSQQDVTNGGNFINTVRKGIEKHSRVNTVGRYGSFDQTTIQDLNTITCIHNTTCSVASLDGTQ